MVSVTLYSTRSSASAVSSHAGFSFNGGVMQPQNTQQPPPGMMQGNGFMTSQQQQAPAYPSSQKLIQDDIDSSLVSLAGNLSVGATGKIK